MNFYRTMMVLPLVLLLPSCKNSERRMSRQDLTNRFDLHKGHYHSKTVHKSGVISDAETAAQVAESILTAHYGKALLTKQLPLEVSTTKNGSWLCMGKIIENSSGAVQLDGYLSIMIDRWTGQILEMGPT